MLRKFIKVLSTVHYSPKSREKKYNFYFYNIKRVQEGGIITVYARSVIGTQILSLIVVIYHKTISTLLANGVTS